MRPYRNFVTSKLACVPLVLAAALSPTLASAQCQSCVNAVVLPSSLVQFSGTLLNSPTAPAAGAGATGLITLTLAGLPATGLSITNQGYKAWCAGWFDSVLNTTGIPGASVFSTYSSTLPAGYGPIVAGDTFNMVNYILNNKAGTVQDVQDAIWLIMTGQLDHTASATATALVSAAKANPTYVPNAGGVMAVFMATGANPLATDVNVARIQFQSLFFEVPVPIVTNQGCAGCITSIVLPSTPVQFATAIVNSVTQPASSNNGFFSFGLTNVPAGLTITNKSYAAWCAGWFDSVLNTTGTPGSPIYSTYSASLPPGYAPIVAGNTFNMVNYILNNKMGTVQDVQDAIWLIMTGQLDHTASAAAQAMVTGAKANPAYCPPTGGIIALFYASGLSPLATDVNVARSQFQSLFIEVPCGITTQTNAPGITMTKTADHTKVNPFQKVTYTYVVKNTGNVTLTNIVVVDDNATPGYTKDDFTVGTIASLAPGASATLTAMVYPPVKESAKNDDHYRDWGWSWWGSNWGDNDDDADDGKDGGTLICKTLSDGKIQFTYRQDKTMSDNTYGRNSSSDWGWWGHQFSNFANNDGAEFQILDKNGNVSLDFVADYVSKSSSYPSGWGTLGIKGGGGMVYSGDARKVLAVDTSLSHNMNQSSKYYQATQDSPAAGTSDWDFEESYTVTLDSSVCGAVGFGGVRVPLVHNYPSKNWGWDKHVVKPVTSMVTNTATATTVFAGANVSAMAKATVTVDASKQGWSQCSKY